MIGNTEPSGWDLLREPREAFSRPTIRDIIERVSFSNGLTVDEITGPAKQRRFVQPRQAVMSLAAQAGFPLAMIGRALNRDHTTVMHGIRAHREQFNAGVVDSHGREIR